jgi:galactitol-specific phosphotransferase system IIB component
MSLLSKILICLGSILVILGLGFIIYKQNEISNRQIAIEAQIVSQKELADNIMRSQHSYATKDDIEKFIKTNNVNLQAIQKDLDKLHANLTAANTIVVTSSGQKIASLPSSGTGVINPIPNTKDTYEYLKKSQLLNIHEDFNGVAVPIGQVGFSAWQPSPWNINILPREYKITNVIGVDDNQRTYVYNKFSVKVDDKNYDVKISSAETKQEYPEAKWSWWNPRLFIGVDGGINIDTTTLATNTSRIKGEFIPSISLGIMSYGKFKNQPDFSVLQVGVGIGAISQKPQIVVTPAAYNIGKHIPFINNTYLAPSMAVGIDGSVSIMGGVKVGL